MDKELDTTTGDYTGNAINTLKNAVYIRLTTPLGSWWADKTIGSQLHLLSREKDLNHVALLAEQYAQEALQPLIADGRADSISVSATQPHNGRLTLLIRVYSVSGGFDYNHGITVI